MLRIHPQEGPLTTSLALKEDGQRVPIREDTFEWWYFDAILEDGSTCVVTYATRLHGMRERDPLAPVIMLNVSRPDGTYQQFLNTYPAREYSAAEDRCDVRIGPNRVRGDLKRYALHAEADGVVADLVLSTVVPGWRRGSALSPEDAAQQPLGWQCVIPSGTATGTLMYDGAEHEVSGTCYHDHQWGHTRRFHLLSPLDHWYWGRGRIGEYSIVFADVVPRAIFGGEKRGLHVFMLAKGDRILSVDGEPVRVTASGLSETKGVAHPNDLELRWDGKEGRVEFAVSNATVIAGLDTYLRFVSDAHLRVDWKGERSDGSARAIWEVMHLR